MIPSFPTFKRLSLEHKEDIMSLVKNFPEYSEFNFSCMFVWDVSEPVFVSLLNDNLVIKFVDFKKSKYYYSLIGENNIDETIKTLIDQSVKDGLEAALHTVPATVVKAIKHPEDFEIIEDWDNHDYILSVSDLAQLRANQFRGKRNLVNRFQKNYGDLLEYRELDLSDPEIHRQIREVLENWESAVPKDSIEIIVEFAAIERTLKHAEKLNVLGFGSYIGNKLEAFTIFERVDSKTALIHFDKANKNYIGIFEHLKHNLAKHLSDDHGVEILNYAQDLGIPGLREAKSSYHPVGYLRKYSVRLAETEA